MNELDYDASLISSYNNATPQQQRIEALLIQPEGLQPQCSCDPLTMNTPGRWLSSTLPLLLFLLIWIPFCNMDNDMSRMVYCARHTRKHFILHDSFTLGYIDRFAEITRTLMQNNVNNMTASIVLKRLENSSKNLCQVRRNHLRQKRQLLLGGVVGAISGLVLPALINNLLYPTHSSISPDVKKFMLKSRALTRRNQLMLASLSSRLDKIEERQQADELLLTILETLHLEEEKFKEITDANISTSPTLTRMMKMVLKSYEKAGIIKLTPMSTSNELSKNLYHINITTTPSRTQRCADAKVEFTIYAPLPSMLCERIVNVHSDYILTSIRAGGKDSGDCRVLPPLYKLLTLPDNTTFSPYQFYTLKGCDVSRTNFTFKMENTFMAVPRLPGSVLSSCGGIRRASLLPHQGVTPFLGCSSYIAAGHSSPSERDIFAPGARLVNERGEFLNPGYTYESEFLFLGAVQNKRSFINKNKTETKDPNHQDWLDTLDTTSSHQIKDATIATLTALVLILVGLASVKLIMRAMGRRKSWSIRPGSPQRTPKTPPTKRITLEDIEVCHNTPTELTLASISAQFPYGRTSYNVDMLSMPDLPGGGSEDVEALEDQPAPMP